jgi:hypothetical protein
MAAKEYVLLKQDHTIANIVVVEESDTEVLDIMIAEHEALYSLDLEAVGYPVLITDTWNATTNSWDSIPVVYDINQIDWSTAKQKE